MVNNFSSFLRSTVFSYFPLGLQLLAFLVSVFLFTPGFHVEDDVGMLSVMMGYFGDPDGHTFFSHAYFSHFLKTLYLMDDSFPWFEWCLEIVNLMAMLAIAWVMMKRKDALSTRISLFILPFFGCWFFLNLHFSFSAFLAGLAGMLLFLQSFRNSHVGNLFLIRTISILLTIICLFIRAEIGWMIFAIFFWVIFLEWKKNIKNRMEILIASSLICILAMAFSKTDQQYYQEDHTWEQAWLYHKARAHFTDYPLPFSQPAADLVSWSYNDYLLIRNWFLADTVIYSLENFNGYRSAAPTVTRKTLDYLTGKQTTGPVKVRPDHTSHAKVVSMDKVKNNDKATSSNKPLPEIGEKSINYLYASAIQNSGPALMILLIFFLSMKSRKIIFEMIPVLLTGCGLLTYVALTMRIPPPRVVIPAVYAMLFGVWWIAESNPVVLKGKFLTFMLAPVSFIFLYQVWVLVPALIFQRTRTMAVIRELDMKSHLWKNRIPVVWRAGFNHLDLYIPFQPSTMKKFSSHRFLFLGCYLQTPLGRRLAPEHKAGSLSEDIFNNPKVVVFVSPSLIPWYRQFVREHIGKEISITLLDRSLQLFDFSPADTIQQPVVEN